MEQEEEGGVEEGGVGGFLGDGVEWGEGIVVEDVDVGVGALDEVGVVHLQLQGSVTSLRYRLLPV